jgi:hypothetical protein
MPRASTKTKAKDMDMDMDEDKARHGPGAGPDHGVDGDAGASEVTSHGQGSMIASVRTSDSDPVSISNCNPNCNPNSYRSLFILIHLYSSSGFDPLTSCSPRRRRWRRRHGH